MKTINQILVLFLLITFTGCGNDDDNGTPPSTTSNEFTIQNTNFETPNAYLIFEPNPTPENAFFLSFLKGNLILDASINPDILISTNTSEMVVLFIHHGGANVSGQQNINLNGGQTYTLEKDNSLVATSISSYTNLATINGVQYGELDETQPTMHQIENTGNGSLTVNTFTINYTTKTGAIDCSYTITDDNGVQITGNYSGSFELIENFF